jgi:hypothetical protein
MTLRCRPRERGDQYSSAFVANLRPVRTVSVYWVPAFAGTTAAWFVKVHISLYAFDALATAAIRSVHDAPFSSDIAASMMRWREPAPSRPSVIE